MGRYKERLSRGERIEQQEHYRATMEIADGIDDLIDGFNTISSELREMRKDFRDGLRDVVQEVKGLRTDLTGQGGIIDRLVTGHMKTSALWGKIILAALVILGALIGVKLYFF